MYTLHKFVKINPPKYSDAAETKESAKRHSIHEISFQKHVYMFDRDTINHSRNCQVN